MSALEAFGEKLPPLISDDEVGKILLKAQNLKKWASDIEEYALSSLLAGKEIPGWKAVEGRKNRSFTDAEKAFEAAVKSGIDEALLYERKPLSLTNVEKLMGKKEFTDTLSEYITVAPGKPTLAPLSDARESITNKITAEEAFKQEENK